MLSGAISVLITGQISMTNALKSVNPDVMLFLFGMFVIGQALEESGYLSHLSYKFFKNVKSTDNLILSILFGFGFISAFLMNDTIAIIGTPVVLLLSKKHRISPKPLLLALAYAITIGSVMSPIGNPQNLLIAVYGKIENPFITFFKFLLIPTIINLFAAYLLLKFFYREQFHNNLLNHSQEPIKDHKLAILSRTSLILVILLVITKVIAVFLDAEIDLGLTYIALIPAMMILISGTGRYSIIKRIDWHTLIFFASMFVLMESVWESGFFQSMINAMNSDITSIDAIFLISVIISQLISNVPLVALYLPLLIQAGISAKGMMALAAGSTIAGNLLVMGAASNVIIIQNAEKRASEGLTFFEFARIGIPLTLINVFVYWLFLAVI